MKKETLCWSLFIFVIFFHFSFGEDLPENFPWDEEDSWEDNEMDPAEVNRIITERLQLSVDEVERRLFYFSKLIDTDHDGKFSYGEFNHFLKNLHAQMKNYDLIAQIKQFDTDNDGLVSLDELYEVYKKISKFDENTSKQDIYERFKILDTDIDGFLTAEELDVFLHPGKNDALLKLEVESLFKHLDKDDDGKLSKTEWVSAGTTSEEKTLLEGQFEEFDAGEKGHLTIENVMEVMRNQAGLLEMTHRDIFNGLKGFFTERKFLPISQEEFTAFAPFFLAQYLDLYGPVLVNPHLLGYHIPGVKETKENEVEEPVDDSVHDSLPVHDEL